MRTVADVVVIGAGIQGTSIAYHLAKKGITKVSVVEMNLIGAGSSGRSAAQIWSQFPEELNIRLTLESFDEYRIFKEELGADTGFKKTGTLLLASKGNAKELEDEISLQKRVGVPTEVLSPGDLSGLIPGLNVGDILFGALCPQDGFVDPHSVMHAYARNARQLGIDIDERVKATGIDLFQDRVVGIRTNEGLISTPIVVNAAGANATQVGGWVGVNLPITNSKRHLFITAPFSALPENVPMVEDADQWYFRREGPGIMMGMGLEFTTEADPETDWGFLEKVVDHALFRLPPLGHARVIRGWAGIRPLTPDNLPILGLVPEVIGYVNACGWGGQGVMHAPIGGRLIAELIADGQTSSMDLESLTMQRFIHTGYTGRAQP